MDSVTLVQSKVCQVTWARLNRILCNRFTRSEWFWVGYVGCDNTIVYQACRCVDKPNTLVSWAPPLFGLVFIGSDCCTTHPSCWAFQIQWWHCWCYRFWKMPRRRGRKAPGRHSYWKGAQICHHHWSQSKADQWYCWRYHSLCVNQYSLDPSCSAFDRLIEWAIFLARKKYFLPRKQYFLRNDKSITLNREIGFSWVEW